MITRANIIEFRHDPAPGRRRLQPFASTFTPSPRVEVGEAPDTKALGPLPTGRLAIDGSTYRPRLAAAMNQLLQDEQVTTQRKPATREASRARCSSGAAAMAVVRAVISVEDAGVQKACLRPCVVEAQTDGRHPRESTEAKLDRRRQSTAAQGRRPLPPVSLRATVNHASTTAPNIRLPLSGRARRAIDHFQCRDVALQPNTSAQC